MLIDYDTSIDRLRQLVIDHRGIFNCMHAGKKKLKLSRFLKNYNNDLFRGVARINRGGFSLQKFC